MPLSIRRAVADDHSGLAALFADAILTTGPSGYSPQQVTAWASADFESIRSGLLSGHTLVAEDESGIVGFSDLAAEGYVSALFVRGDRQRQGVGSALLAEIIAEARRQGVARLQTRASVFSRGTFAKFGFRLIDVQIVERRGATFQQEIMELMLNRDPS
ncbi:MAG TPA: GNAT family N-acetyltransferase [Pirellulales bacterium]